MNEDNKELIEYLDGKFGNIDERFVSLPEVFATRDEIVLKKDFEELELVIEHNPEAVTYYKNKIFKLTKERPPYYAIEIKNQLIKWNCWN